MKLDSLERGFAQISQKDSGAGLLCDNTIIVVLTMCDLTLSILQKN